MLLCDCPKAQGDFQESWKEIGLLALWWRVSEMVFFPQFLVCLCRNLGYSSVFILKENTEGGGKSMVRSSETEFTAPRKKRMLAIHKFSRMFPREQRQRERDRDRKNECVCFGFQRWSESEFNLAGPHTVSGNSPLLGKIPSTFLDTSSRHKIPGKVKEMY